MIWKTTKMSSFPTHMLSLIGEYLVEDLHDLWRISIVNKEWNVESRRVAVAVVDMTINNTEYNARKLAFISDLIVQAWVSHPNGGF